MTEFSTSHVTMFINAINQGFLEVFGQQELDSFRKEESKKEGCSDSGYMYLAALSEFLEKRIGSSETEGLLVSVGSCAYRFLKSAFDHELGFSRLDFRLLPTARRMEAGANLMAEKVIAPIGITLKQERDAHSIRWVSKEHGSCGNFPAAMIGGIMHELLTDISGGKSYPLLIEKSGDPAAVRIEIRINSGHH